jgi:hypothetical protein
MTRYMRVKSKSEGHEFDLPVESFDSSKYERVDKARYPETSRPRRPKLKVNLAEGRRSAPVDSNKE